MKEEGRGKGKRKKGRERGREGERKWMNEIKVEYRMDEEWKGGSRDVKNKES